LYGKRVESTGVGDTSIWGKPKFPNSQKNGDGALIQAVNKKTVLAVFALIKIREKIFPVSAGDHLVFERLKSTCVIDQFFDLFICLPDLTGFDFVKDIREVCVDINAYPADVLGKLKTREIRQANEEIKKLIYNTCGLEPLKNKMLSCGNRKNLLADFDQSEHIQDGFFIYRLY
jgi:hypothetical protein